MYNTKSEEKTTSNTVTETSTASQNTEVSVMVKKPNLNCFSIESRIMLLKPT